MTAAKAPTRIEIVVGDPAWGEADLRPLIRRACRAALRAAGQTGGITVLLTDDCGIHRLNRDFRGKDKPTNVLSFPAPANPEGHLGDLAMARGVVLAEARAAGKPLADHVTHLAVHGSLHLAGYDHEDDAEAAEMEALEVRVLAGLGVADPYEAAA